MTAYEMFLGYEVETMQDGSRRLLAPCGCQACDHGHTSGHFACSTPSEELLAMEEAGDIYRGLDDSTWSWYVA